MGSGFLLKRGRKLLLIYPSTTDFYLSERKWKEKLKEWKFDKKISTTDMRIVVAKAEKRARNEGKDTTFGRPWDFTSREAWRVANTLLQTIPPLVY